MKNIAVILTYELPKTFDQEGVFRDLLIKLGWNFSINGADLPSSACIKIFHDAKNESEAADMASQEVTTLARAMREQTNYKDFAIKRCFLIAQREGGSAGVYGHDL